MQVAYGKSALKGLRRLPPNIARQIRDKIMQYAGDPASLANRVKRLQSSESCRLRVGDDRVLFDITITDDGRTMTVLTIGHRRDVYR